MSWKGHLFVAVIGSRQFSDYARMARELSADREALGAFVLVSGGALGADSLSERWLRTQHGMPDPCIVRPLWKTVRLNEDGTLLAEIKDYAAGLKRNTTLIDIADLVIAYWNGVTRGTKDGIHKASTAGKLYAVRYF